MIDSCGIIKSNASLRLPLSRMNDLVLFQVRLFGEAGEAVMAFERPFAPVDELVLLQVGLSVESPLALAALEEGDAGVDLLVDFEVLRKLEGFVAVFASVLRIFARRVPSSLVKLQRFRR